MIRQFPMQTLDRFRVLEEGHGQIDRELDRTLLQEEMVPVGHGPADHDFRYGA